MRRLFVAIDLSITVVERLVMFQGQLREQVDESFDESVRLRLVDATNIHLTLKFLGDTTPVMVPRIRNALQTLCEPLFAFEVECVGVGAFPKLQAPRIIWAGLDEESSEVLGLLQRTVEKELHQLGIEKEQRPFHPHITLGRVKSGTTPSFEELLGSYGEVGFGSSYIREMVLYESHLDHLGARYEVVDRFRLGTEE